MPSRSHEISSNIDATTSNFGVYVVEIQNFQQGPIHVKVLDPLGAEIVLSKINQQNIEEFLMFLSVEHTNYYLKIEVRTKRK